ncbi:MAG: M13 family metallopeptidase [Mycobacteriaceae bacterium]
MTSVLPNSDTPSGIDFSFVDSQIRPQDDLFAHVNGQWLRDYEIPADRAVDGAFRVLFDRAEEHVRDLITEAAEAHAGPATEQQRIGDLYTSFMNEEAVESLGIGPLSDELTQITEAADIHSLGQVLGRLQRSGVGGWIGHYVNTDAKRSDRYLLHLTQSGLGLPDESYYREEAHCEIRAAYRAHIAAMFRLAGITADAEQVFELETKIAANHWDVVQSRDADLSYNLLTIADLLHTAPEFGWESWYSMLNIPAEHYAEVVVRQPSFLSGTASLWINEYLDQWKAWALWQVIHARAPFLTRAFVEENFAFYGKALSGTEEIRERWKRAVSLVEELLGDAVGKLYVERHFPAQAKSQMEVLVDNLIKAYRRNISELEWMSSETRKRALEKLEKFTPKIGYPAHWRDYSHLIIDRNDLIGNYRRGYEAEYQRDLNKLGGPVDRDEWFMTPQTVNAYYNPGMNEIVFPAAILQPPFFDPHADDAANYGGIGAVIGHEIGHGFDDQGSKYDGDGNLVDWWTDSDRAEFSKRTDLLIKQYNNFEPQGLPGHHVNGEFTIGENIGDLGGLSIALVAYEISLGGKPAPVIDGFTGLQRVFFGWAQVWRTKARDAEAIRRLSVDPHSPPEFRCNGVVSNINAFYDAFDVTPGDALYLDPKQRVQIW